MSPADDPVRTGSSRALPRWLALLAAAALVARVGTGVWEARHPAPALDRVAWVPIADAAAASRQRHRPVLYEFGAAWCGPCQQLAREVFADEQLAADIERNFVPVRVVDRQREDGHNLPEVEALQRAYAIDGFPTLVVAWPDSSRHETMSGYAGKQPTRDWLHQMADKAAMERMQALGAPGGPGARTANGRSFHFSFGNAPAPH